jgi:hypothetical protein
MIHIDVFIPFYMYETDVHRYNLTKVIFKHMANVKEWLNQTANFTFTLLGSENERSRQLAAQFFPASDYYEFNQNDPIFHGKDFYYMLDYKVKTGMQVAKSKNPDIILWMGSNDYVPYKFFVDIIEFYNPNAPQMYGIDNFYNGENAVFYCIYDGHSKSIDIHNEAWWWSGLSPYPRNKYKYCGGAIGLNKAAYTKYPDIISCWSFDEGEDERMISEKGDVQKFNSSKLFFFNIKMKSGTEINSYNGLRSYFANEVIQFSALSPDLRKHISDDTKYVMDLMSSL